MRQFAPSSNSIETALHPVCPGPVVLSSASMIGEKRPLSATTFAEGNVSGIPSPSTVILDRQDHPTHDPMQAVEARSAGSKRKSVCDSATGVDLAPCAMKSTVTTNECASLSSVAENQGVQGANGASTIGGRKREVDDLNISCLQGSTMRIPLGGKTVPFRIARRRGSGISSVVFECERIDDGGVGGIGDIGGDGGGGDREADGGPQVVTVKVIYPMYPFSRLGSQVVRFIPTASGLSLVEINYHPCIVFSSYEHKCCPLRFNIGRHTDYYLYVVLMRRNLDKKIRSLTVTGPTTTAIRCNTLTKAIGVMQVIVGCCASSAHAADFCFP